MTGTTDKCVPFICHDPKTALINSGTGTAACKTCKTDLKNSAN